MVAGETSNIRLEDVQKRMTSTSKSAVGLFDPLLKFKNKCKVVTIQREHFGMLFVGNQCPLIHVLIYIFGAYPLFVLRKAVYRLKVHWKLQRLLALVLRVRFQKPFIVPGSHQVLKIHKEDHNQQKTDVNGVNPPTPTPAYPRPWFPLQHAHKLYRSFRLQSQFPSGCPGLLCDSQKCVEQSRLWCVCGSVPALDSSLISKYFLMRLLLYPLLTTIGDIFESGRLSKGRFLGRLLQAALGSPLPMFAFCLVGDSCCSAFSHL